MTQNDLVKEIIKSLDENQECWTITKHELIHRSSKITFWIGNGWSFLCVESPFKASFSIFNRWKLFRAIKRCKIKKLNETIKQ